MKSKYLLIAAIAISGLLATGCGPLVTTGPDVAVGGGIFPAPLLTPPTGPFVYRPGAPHGPGFSPGISPSRYPGRPIYTPGNPGRPGGPGNVVTPGRPGNIGNPGNFGNPGNNRQPGTGIGAPGNPGGGGNQGNPLPPNNGGNPGGGGPGMPQPR